MIIRKAAHKAAVGIGLFALLCGCAGPAASDEKPGPLAFAPKAPSTLPATAPSAEAGGSDPQSVERRAAAQAKAIDELLAARNTPPVAGNSLNDATPPDPAAPPVPIERPRPPAAIAPAAADQPPAVVPPVAQTPPVDEPVKPPIPNTPVSVLPNDQPPVRAPAPGQPRPAASGLEQIINDRAGQNPRDVSAQLDQQLLLLLKGEAVPTPQTMAGMAPDDREMLTTLMDGISNFRAGVAADANALMARKIRPLADMADRLKSESDLTLSNAVLCSKVVMFGTYVPFDPPKVAAMTRSNVVVYCEVSNFVSTLDEKGQYFTKLHEDIVLYTETGLPVKTLYGKNLVDVSRSRRHDFFLACAVEIPGTLSTGRHVIKVTVVDQNANHVAETTIPLAVIAN